MCVCVSVRLCVQEVWLISHSTQSTNPRAHKDEGSEIHIFTLRTPSDSHATSVFFFDMFGCLKSTNVSGLMSF